MKKEIKWLSIFLFMLILLFAVTGISEADFEGTIGTRFTIIGSEFGIKKPKVYIEYEKRPGVVKKVYAKVETWSDTSVTCLWTTNLSTGTYNLWVKPNIKKATPLSEGTFSIMNPVIDRVTPNTLTQGATITINGQFFTNKKPRVYLKDLTSQKRKSCRVLNSTMDPVTGVSSLNFVMPKWGSDTYEIVLRTFIGEISFTISPTPEQFTLSINPATLPEGVVNNPYNQTVKMTVSGGEPPYRYSCSVSGGSGISASVNLSGMSSGSAECIISGTPLIYGSYTVAFHAYDFANSSDSVGPIAFSVSPSSNPLDNWNLRNPFPGNYGSRIIFGNNIFISVSRFGKIFTTSDGIDWTERFSLTNPSLLETNDVAYGNGVFVAVGSNGSVVTSPDGINWTIRSSGTTTQLNGIAYGNGVFVVVGYNGVILSSTDGANWTLATTLGTTQALSRVAYGNGMFIGIGGWGTIVTSNDGLNWIARDSGTTDDLNDITYANDTFVIVGSYGRILTSPDGIIWTARDSGTKMLLIGINYGNGIFVTVGWSGVIVTSNDGTSWIPRISNVTTDLASVAYGNGVFVVVSGYGPAPVTTVVTSPDGLEWTARASSTIDDLKGIAYGNDVFVAVGGSTGYQGRGTIATSTDGALWSAQTLATSNTLDAVTYGNGIFVAVGWQGTIVSSPDGVNWSDHTLEAFNQLYGLNGVTYGNGVFVAVGDGGVIVTSNNGEDWFIRSSPSSSSLKAVAYGNGIFIAVGFGENVAENGVILSSSDGTTWTVRFSATSGGQVSGIAYGNGTFVAVGGIIVTSPDGINWTWTVGNTNIYLPHITYSNGLFVAVGRKYINKLTCQAVIASSPDGVNWTRRGFGSYKLPTAQDYWCEPKLNGIVYGNSTFIAVGQEGIIIQSDPVQ